MATSRSYPRCPDRIVIATKSTRHAHRKRLPSLRALGEDRLVDRRRILVFRESRPRLEDGIEIWPLEHFLATLWNDDW